MKNRRCSVLVGESDRSIARCLRFSLEQAGFAVFVAYDGEQAAILAARQRFDLMIFDFELPEMGGAKLCRHVREDLRLTEVPIVICSDASSEAEAGALVYSHGISQVFYKPINPSVVTEFAQETVDTLVAVN